MKPQDQPPTISWKADTAIVPAPGRPGSYCPERFTAEWKQAGLKVRVSLVEGEGVSTDVLELLRASETGGRTLREVTVEWVAKAIDGAVWAVDTLSPGELAARGAHTIKVAGRPVRPRLDDEHLRAVAETHAAATSKPTTAVARRFALTQANAAQRVALARRRGFLAPAGQR